MIAGSGRGSFSWTLDSNVEDGQVVDELRRARNIAEEEKIRFKNYIETMLIKKSIICAGDFTLSFSFPAVALVLEWNGSSVFHSLHRNMQIRSIHK